MCFGTLYAQPFSISFMTLSMARYALFDLGDNASSITIDERGIISSGIPNLSHALIAADTLGPILGFVVQQYLPDELVNRKYYVPKTTSKYELLLKEMYEKRKNAK